MSRPSSWNVRAAAVAAAALAMTLCAGPAVAEPVTLTIVHVNDLDRIEESGDRGGIARLAAVVKDVRASARHVLVTHGGDAISPSLLSSFDKGAHMIDLLNQVGVDAMALGYHEFDFTPAVTAARIAEATFPILSNNAVEPDGTLLDGVTDHLLLDVDRYRVGVFGLTTAMTPEISSSGDVTFLPAAEVASERSAMLRAAGADLVIALAHTGHEEDAEVMRRGGVDLLLSGHDHDMRIDVGHDSTFVESGSQADFVTVVEIAMDMVEGRRGPRFVWEPGFRVVNTRTVTPDPELEAAVTRYLERLSRELDIEIGTTTVELDSRRAVVRTGEAVIGNLIADAMRAATGADIAMTNGGGIRGDKVYARGTTLLRRDIQTELPFGNRSIVLEVTGAELHAALENGVGGVTMGAGRFPHVSGMTYRFDASRPAGDRIAGVTVGGEPLGRARTYRLATNDFMGRGGDGYSMFVEAPRLIDSASGKLMAAQVIEEIAAAGEIAPRLDGRIVRID